MNSMIRKGGGETDAGSGKASQVDKWQDITIKLKVNKNVKMKMGKSQGWV